MVSGLGEAEMHYVIPSGGVSILEAACAHGDVTVKGSQLSARASNATQYVTGTDSIFQKPPNGVHARMPHACMKQQKITTTVCDRGRLYRQAPPALAAPNTVLYSAHTHGRKPID